MKALLFALLLMASMATLACLNEHHVSKSGKTDTYEFALRGTHFNKKHSKNELELYIRNLEARNTANPQEIFEKKNSIAVALIRLNRLKEAEEILNQLYKEQPNDYSVLANLGTLYELQGKNEQALKFIRQAMITNPESHGRSEWFHVKVLEFKLKNIPEAQIPASNILQIRAQKTPASWLAGQVSYQLQERIPFTPAPNLAMAKILDEYAGFLADSVSISAAYLMYDIATDYDRNNLLKIKEKKVALLPYLKKYKAEIPRTRDYYADPLDAAGKSTLPGGIADPVLNKGKQQVFKNKISGNYILPGIGSLIAVAGIFLYRRRKAATA